LYRYIAGSRTLESASEPRIACEAGRILGRFHQLAEAVPASSLHPTLPRFHDLGWRLEQLREAEHQGLAARRESTASWIALAHELAALCAGIPWAQMPLRICHNDTKLSNILFDAGSDRALCLIDLDTLMPGYLLYDVGDAVRTLMNPLPEDHPDWEAIRTRPELFRAFVQGLRQSGLRLEAPERDALPYGVVLMPLLHGIRALADYLQGDRYYKTAYPGQNRVRACNLLQFAHRASEQLDTLRQICREELN
jgi:Ser/Thr protein kinase RdoA (MazF antagonist)